MSRKVILSFLLCIPTSLNADLVYRTTNRMDADRKVYITQNRMEAQLVVKITKNKADAVGKFNVWFYESNRMNADWEAYFTENRMDADLVVFVEGSGRETKKCSLSAFDPNAKIATP